LLESIIPTSSVVASMPVSELAAPTHVEESISSSTVAEIEIPSSDPELAFEAAPLEEVLDGELLEENTYEEESHKEEVHEEEAYSEEAHEEGTHEKEIHGEETHEEEAHEEDKEEDEIHEEEIPVELDKESQPLPTGASEEISSGETESVESFEEPHAAEPELHSNPEE
jgi:hypothetical protein